MQPNFKDLFPELPSDARVWIYCSDRVLDVEESKTITDKLASFIHRWSTHGSAMKASSGILLDRFIVIAADEQRLAASGCSIDSSVRFIKELGAQFNINFFDRLKVYVLTSDGIIRAPYHSISEISGYYFDPLIPTLEELRSNWPVKI